MKSKVIGVRFPLDILARLDAIVRRTGKPRNQVLMRLLDQKLPPLEGGQPPAPAPALRGKAAKRITPKTSTQEPDELTQEEIEQTQQQVEREIDTHLEQRSRGAAKSSTPTASTPKSTTLRTTTQDEDVQDDGDRVEALLGL